MAASRKKNEQAFLAEQSEIAADGIRRSATALVRHLRQAVNPMTWVKAHPIASMGAAAVGGFAATAATGRETAPRTNGTHPPPEAEHREEREKHQPSLKQELVSHLAHEAIGVLRPIVTGVISAYLASNRPAHDQVEPEAHEN